MSSIATVADDAEAIAAEVRARLGVPLLDQLKWSYDEAYRQWRVAVEQAGVLVFHFRIESRSGFAMALDILPIIGVSTTEEWDTARQFTLMHELGHIVLGDSTIHEKTPFHAYSSPEERWCNRFAAAVLVPRETLVGLDITQRFGEQGLWGEQDVRELARIFKVSPSVIVRRLDRFNLINSEVASHLRMTFDDYTPEAKKKGGGPTFFIKELASWGYFVPDILFQSYREGVTDLAELTMALRASPVMVERYEAELSKRSLSAVP